MAERPVFVCNEKSYVKNIPTEFTFCPGFAKVQKERSAVNLHEAFLRRYPDAKVLEISSFSREELGRSLSAFHLTIGLKDGRRVPVETAYQAGKIFRDGGPFTDLLDASPSQAKRDPRLSQFGPITGFTFNEMSFPTQPLTLFYTWLYMKALSEHPELTEALMEYTAFTDIVYNPAKSVSCQARSAACYVSLRKKGEIEKALQDLDFLQDVIKQFSAPSSWLLEQAKQTSKPAASRARKSAKQISASAMNADDSKNGTDKEKTSSATAKEEKKGSPCSVGQTIVHPKFGAGTVVSISPDQSSAQIDFGEHGIKKLSMVWIASFLSTKN